VSDVLVLCYHALSPDWPAALSTTPERFEEQLRWLVGRGYRGATFEQVVTSPPAARTVAVTFDDGYRSVLELALPIMRRLGLPGSIYVPTNYAGQAGPMAWDGIDQWIGGPHEQELHPLGWDELGTLAAEGWEVGSHTRSHPRLTQLGDADLADELEGSKAACERGMGRACRTIAYPYGDVDGRVVAAARRAGYEAAASLPKGRFTRGEPLDWPRVGVYNADDLRRFKLKSAIPLRRLRSSAAWDLATAARRYARRR
jgi:peptidoglycan/xylan/chitin deacetylase (PgdA/CDA1 family)